MNPKIKGYALAALAAATYGMNPLFALPLYADGLDANSVLLFRYLLALPIVGVMLRWRGRSFRVSVTELLQLALMGVLMVFSSIALFESYNHMEAGIASTILFVYPIMVAIIMALCFREKLTLQTILCVLLATLGIALLYNGKPGTSLSLAGTVLVLLSALSYAIYIVAVSKTRLCRMPTIKVTFYVLLFGALVLIVRSLTTCPLRMPSQPLLWGNALCLAIFPTAISFLCTTAAIQYIGSTRTAILGALEPLTAIFFGIAVFSEQVSPRQWVGIAVILIAVTLVIAEGFVHRYLTHFRRLFPIRRKNRKKSN